MKINDWVGKYQLVYMHNDPIEGLTYKWADDVYIVSTHHIPTEEELDKARGN
jgi:hypothetical protein